MGQRFISYSNTQMPIDRNARPVLKYPTHRRTISRNEPHLTQPLSTCGSYRRAASYQRILPLYSNIPYIRFGQPPASSNVSSSQDFLQSVAIDKLIRFKDAGHRPCFFPCVYLKFGKAIDIRRDKISPLGGHLPVYLGK